MSDIGHTCAFNMVWVPGRCGLHRNDLVDCLAKETLQLPMDVQKTVPVHYADVKRRVHGQVLRREKYL